MGDRAPDRFLSALRRELRHGVLPVWVLESLEDGPSYGYELLERLRSRHGDEMAASASRLYPALARLRIHGLVRVYHGKDSRGPVRKYYELTDQGRAILPEIRALALTLRTLSGPSYGPTVRPVGLVAELR
ncbi:MAG: PadR family transcriptional regulator [Thermoplasmata archaeon]|nr:PadR family transcriptional regulator [Thermoplasmata archaeon]MCI4362121.1 PadR family transcriptional regulator [Thermoplasmata archaeon]MCI4370985.1 PadR family transcriptional regulator [Thermoplasmata archaeon]